MAGASDDTNQSDLRGECVPEPRLANRLDAALACLGELPLKERLGILPPLRFMCTLGAFADLGRVITGEPELSRAVGLLPVGTPAATAPPDGVPSRTEISCARIRKPNHNTATLHHIKYTDY